MLTFSDFTLLELAGPSDCEPPKEPVCTFGIAIRAVDIRFDEPPPEPFI